MKKKFKIFGERNSGTNLIRYLVAQYDFIDDEIPMFRNRIIDRTFLTAGKLIPKAYDELYDILVCDRIRSVGGWKHAIPDLNLIANLSLKPVFIVKHPTFWLRSFTNRPFHHYRNDELYLPRRIENMDIRPLSHNELIIKKMTSFANAAKTCEGIVIQYESLIYHFEESQKLLIDIFGRCKQLPELDVRNFIQSKDAKDYKKIHRNALLAPDAATWAHNAQFRETLEFFGYEAGCWHKTLPFTL